MNRWDHLKELATEADKNRTFGLNLMELDTRDVLDLIADTEKAHAKPRSIVQEIWSKLRKMKSVDYTNGGEYEYDGVTETIFLSALVEAVDWIEARENRDDLLPSINPLECILDVLQEKRRRSVPK